MENIICPDCKKKQWSIADCEYVKLFMTCWSCDKKRWEDNKLFLEEFEKKEKEAAQSGGWRPNLSKYNKN